MNRITDKQAEVMSFILSEFRQKGRPPTNREIQDHFGWKGNASSKCHLLALEKKGYIRTVPHLARAIEFKLLAFEFEKETQVVK